MCARARVSAAAPTHNIRSVKIVDRRLFWDHTVSINLITLKRMDPNNQYNCGLQCKSPPLPPAHTLNNNFKRHNKYVLNTNLFTSELINEHLRRRHVAASGAKRTGIVDDMAMAAAAKQETKNTRNDDVPIRHGEYTPRNRQSDGSRYQFYVNMTSIQICNLWWYCFRARARMQWIGTGFVANMVPE